MDDEVNFADPDFEPTDEQLLRLSAEAFADVRQRQQAALVAVQRRIAALRAAATSSGVAPAAAARS